MRRVLLAWSLALASWSTGAPAATMKAVYTGTVSSGLDQTNVLGLGANLDLTGLAFTATFIYDPATLGAYRTTYAGFDRVYGGSAYPASSPVSSAVINIAGGTYSTSTSYFGQALTVDKDWSPGGQAEVTHHVQHYQYEDHNDGDGNYHSHQALDDLYLNISNATDLIPGSLNTSFYLGALTGFNGYFQAYTYDYDCANGDGNCTEAYSRHVYASLAPISLNVAPLSAVPLPGALPLFATALGGIGLAGWRRKRKAVV